MNAATASLINALTLIAMSLWGYFGSETPSLTAFIPAAFGAVLLAMNSGVKKENKVIAHIAVTLTLLVLVSLFKPLSGAMGRGDTAATIRIGLMIATSILAMVFFIKSFRDARKAREAAGN
ncbi:MAG: hypothetical protein AB8G22_21615 [Saprospiraceae bacterium]